MKKPNPPFPSEVRNCSFFYMDKFVTTTCASTLYLHKYELDSFTVQTRWQCRLSDPISHNDMVITTCFELTHSLDTLCRRSQDTKDDIRRLRNLSKYKLVRAWDLGCQSILSMSCFNSFLSPLLLLSGSDKTVSVFDMAVGAFSTP